MDPELRQIFNQILKSPNYEKWIMQLDSFVDSKKCVCAHCGKTKVPKSFYHIKKNIVYPSGRLPICKRCINKLFFYFEKKYQDSYAAMKKICSLFDLFYSESLFQSCIYDDRIVGRYLQKLNLRQNKYKTSFDDTKSMEGIDK